MLALLAATLLATPVAGAPAGVNECDECVLEAGESELCPAHEAAEEQVVREFEAEFTPGSTPKKLSLLAEIAATTSTHANAPSRRVARVLGSALSNDEPEVRSRAVELLQEGQHHDETVLQLLAAMDGVEELIEGIDKRVMRGRKEKAIPGEEAVRIMRMALFVNQLLLALSRAPDERSLGALREFAKRKPTKMTAGMYEAAIGSLLAFDCHEAVEAAIDAFARLEKALRRGPIEGIGAASSERRVVTLAGMMIGVLRPPGSEYLEKTHAQLEAYAALEQLPKSVPDWREERTSSVPVGWRRWLSRHKKQLPPPPEENHGGVRTAH